jgi:ADP-ribosylglycohydrolase
MLGSIAGDIIGSPYEAHPITIKKFPLFTERSHFTDDTVLTVATAWALLHGAGYAETYRNFGQAHPNRGYGGSFRRWLFHPDMEPYNSFGNGSAMRVSPVGLACGSGEAFYGGVPEPIAAEVRSRLPQEFLAVIDAFYEMLRVSLIFPICRPARACE